MSLEAEVVPESIPTESEGVVPTRAQILEMRGEVEKVFYAVAAELNDLVVGDSGRTLRSRHRINAMILHLSPVESRHEKILRACVGMLSVQSGKIAELSQAVLSVLRERGHGGGPDTAGAGEASAEQRPAEPEDGEEGKEGPMGPGERGE